MKAVKLFVDRRSGRFGSRLNARFVISFVFATALSSSALFVLSALLVSRAVNVWFELELGESLAWAFAVAVAASLCGGYVLLGATWLVLRTEGELQQKAIGWARWGLAWVALGVALVSLATPLASETVRMRWFDFPRTLGLMLLPAATLFVGWWVWKNLGRSDGRPFAGAVAIFVLAFIGLAYSLFPYVIMDRMTIWDAAAHPSALVFMLVGTLIVLPFIVGYTIYAYRVFRGKARAEDYGHGKYT